MTGMAIRPRAEAWRGRGRPKDDVPEELLDALRATVGTTDCVTVALDDSTTPEDITVLKRKVRNACRQLGLREHIQEDDTEVRFYATTITKRGNRNDR